ncbi:MAG: hypothetical protein ACREV0_03715 [Burkholderiales bacterium]
MKLSSLEAIVKVLNEAGIRYLIAGGVAVNAHGYIRFTKDVDLVIELERSNALRALEALASLEFRPIIPVRAEDFVDAHTRQQWIEQKNMKVMQLFSDQHRDTPIDIFVAIPFDFEEEYRMAYIDDVAPGLPVRFVRLRTLIEMKEAVNRPRDRDDVQHLRWIEEDKGNE